MIDRDDYPNPVSQLLDHGPLETAADDVDNWFDYVGHYGLGEIDVPPLLDLMAERVKANSKYPNERYAPIHACRALAQLGDEVANDYLVTIKDRSKDKQLVKNTTAALGLLGQRALARQQVFFHDATIADIDRISVAEKIFHLCDRYSQLRDECAAFLSETLSHYSSYSRDLNGFLAYCLVELKATEAFPIIEQAFEAGQLNDELVGSLAAVQVALGLADEAAFDPDDLLCEDDRMQVQKRRAKAGLKVAQSPVKTYSAMSGSYSIAEHLKQ